MHEFLYKCAYIDNSRKAFYIMVYVLDRYLIYNQQSSRISISKFIPIYLNVFMYVGIFLDK